MFGVVKELQNRQIDKTFLETDTNQQIISMEIGLGDLLLRSLSLLNCSPGKVLLIIFYLLLLLPRVIMLMLLGIHVPPWAT
jgi:hypothetical protein